MTITSYSIRYFADSGKKPIKRIQLIGAAKPPSHCMHYALREFRPQKAPHVFQFDAVYFTATPAQENHHRGASNTIGALSDLRYVPMKNYEEHRLP
jgi:hypothetical protein